MEILHLIFLQMAFSLDSVNQDETKKNCARQVQFWYTDQLLSIFVIIQLKSVIAI